MQNFFVKMTATTPEIKFSPVENIFHIIGTSAPEDVRAVYYPVIEWIIAFSSEIIKDKNHKYTAEKPLIFKSDLEYFNSSSAKFMYDIFMELKKLPAAGIPIVVEWYHQEEDIDLKEAGLDIAALAGMEFSYIPKP